MAIEQLSDQFALGPAAVHLKAEAGQTVDSITDIASLAALAEFAEVPGCLPATFGSFAEIAVYNQICDRLAYVLGPPPQKRLKHR